MKRVVPQESGVDCLPSSLNGAQSETSGGYRRVQTSAAMLGLALSFGASAPFFSEPELALAADGSALTVLPAVERGKSQSPGFAAPAEAVGSSSYHTVEAGESLWQIAAQHKANVQAIKAANGIAVDEVLRVGQVIRVPAVGMDNLAAASSSSRLALKANVLGGVGGDLAADSIASLGVGPSVDDLEKIQELEEDAFLLSDADQLNEEYQAADELSAEDVVAEVAVAQEQVVAEKISLAALPTAQADSGPETWSITDAAKAPEAPQVLAVERGAEAEEAPAAPALATSLPLHEEPAQSAPTPVNQPDAAPVPSADAADGKKQLVAATLPLNPANAEAAVEVGTVRAYQVKQGDTLWSVAARNGLTLDELLSHNHNISQPETLAVGNSLSIPVTSVDSEPQSTSVAAANVPAANVPVASRSREQVIRDHLARIRESNSAVIDRDELNARIREARQELERSRSEESSSVAVALEYHSSEPSEVVSSAVGGAQQISETSLTVREGAQTVANQWTVTDVAQAEPQQIAALRPMVFPDAIDASEAEPAQLDPVTDPSQLLAAAPLGPEAYRSSPDLPVGQTVSPNMPMMPGADEFLPEAPALSNGFVWPTQGTLTSGYGWRWGRMHRGIDIAGPVGTPIVAAAPGVVVRSGWNSGGYGNLVDIRHADGSMTRYAHNSRLLVRQGEQVRQGQQIAAMGSTGYSTGPHLHFEVHVPSNGTVNPMAYLPGR